MIVQVFPNSGAAKAGLRENDVIVKVMSVEVSSFVEVKEALSKHRAGEVVQATVLRDGAPVDFEILLGAPEEIFLAGDHFGSGGLNGELSARRSDFSNAIQHDSVLQPTDCGGPVTDLSGRVVGINIARADRVATYALPNMLCKKFSRSLIRKPLVEVKNSNPRERKMIQRWLIASCILASLATTATAQSPDRGGFFGGRGRLLVDLDEVRQELGVNELQVELLDALQEDLAEQRLTIREVNDGPRSRG